MNQFLLDPDFLIKVIQGDPHSEKLYRHLLQSSAELYITSSMIPALSQQIASDSSFQSRLTAELTHNITIITTTGHESLHATQAKHPHIALFASSYKRVCPQGQVISQNQAYSLYGLKLMAPDSLPDLFHLEPTDKTPHIPILDLPKEYRHNMMDIDQTLIQSPPEADYIQGQKHQSLKEALSDYLKVNHVIPVASGTDALLLSLKSLAIQLRGKDRFNREDIIITTSYTFVATGNAILLSGATPLFLDIDPDSYNISPSKLRESLRVDLPGLLGIIPVHLFGLSCDMSIIRTLAEERGLFIVEDAAQGFGGELLGEMLGTLGDIAAFSFYPSKNLGAYGDGGLIATNRADLADWTNLLANQGFGGDSSCPYPGQNSRLDNIQAGVLLSKLSSVNDYNSRRRFHARRYVMGLQNISSLKTPVNPDFFQDSPSHHVFHQFTIRVTDGRRDALKSYLEANKVEARIYYPIPLHQMAIFKTRSIVPEPLIQTELLSKEALSLPISPLQTIEETDRIIDLIIRFFSSVH
ncbi:MAG: DegT/DnrJ/EryC1/StrS family aminotransferase [Spirochaetota bacterium]|nr:DegT/DnrJ/EryC1/StrS family aminotransferase [Spirochaetota bacterium]